MKVITYVCDRCKTPLEEEIVKINPMCRSIDSKKDVMIFADSEERDYCMNCAEEIYDFMMGKAKTKRKKEDKEPEQQEEPAKPERKIDEPKVIALLKAGWSTKKVAEEMCSTEDNICEIVRTHRIPRK